MNDCNCLKKITFFSIIVYIFNYIFERFEFARERLLEASKTICSSSKIIIF